MKLDCYIKAMLSVIAIALGVLALGRTSPVPATAAPAPANPAAEAPLPYRDVEFIPSNGGAFIMFSRRTGEVARYDLQAVQNRWVWTKLGPTGRVAKLGDEPTNPQ